MKTIQYVATLYYYDGPQVFEARDDSGGHYVAVMVAPTSSHDRFLVTPAAPSSLRGFRAGELDLRSLMLEQGAQEWFLAESDGGVEERLKLIPQAGALVDSHFLPDSGFCLERLASPNGATVNSQGREPLGAGQESL
jgi:hypothetical protein